MADDDYIKNIADKYNVSLNDAHHILVFLNTNNIPPGEAPKIIAIAKRILQEKGKYKPASKNDKGNPLGVTIGGALYQAERTLHGTKMIGQKRNLPKDRHDTTTIPKKKPKMVSQEWVKTDTVIGKDGVPITVTYSGKEKYKQPGQYLPVYHIRKELGEIPSTRQLPPPKYYYFDLDGEFIHDAEDPPTKDPAYRIDKAKFIPYIQLEVVHLVQASKYPKPVFDIDPVTGVRTPVIGTDGQQLFKKDHGERTLRLNYYVGNMFIHSQSVRMDYEDDVKFRIYMGDKLRALILKNLGIFVNEYGSKFKGKYQQDLRKRKHDEAFAEYYGEVPSPVRDYMHLIQKKADTIRREKDEALLPEPKYKKIDGKYVKIDRKKKASKKVKVIRKKIIKRKPIKKPVKRCICKKKVVKRVNRR
jgi:hypothetical protein